MASSYPDALQEAGSKTPFCTNKATENSDGIWWRTLSVKNNEVGQLLPLAAAPASDRATHAGDPPLVWVLTCHREGGNAQTIGLAEALGWPFEVKRIVHKKLELVAEGSSL
jgi:hypothetical protein